MDALPFLKMHGLGNDFAVFDGRRRGLSLTADQVRAIADRRAGVGCDQLIVIEPPPDDGAAAFMRIHNADGGEVDACGNAARCVAALLLAETGGAGTVIATNAGRLDAWSAGDRISVDMGPARTGWDEIPLARATDTLHVPAAAGPLADAVAVNVGNPHAVYFVADVETLALADCGPAIEHHPLFPQRTNVEAVQVLGPDRLRLRVWERGVGITRACGTGACAAVVAAHRRGLAGRNAEVILDGGQLAIQWRDDNHVVMTGPVATTFRGLLDPAVLA